MTPHPSRAAGEGGDGLTEDDLRQMRERCEAASPEPWAMEFAGVVATDGKPVCEIARIAYSRHDSRAEAEDSRVRGNEAFVLHARTDIPRALSEIARLRARLAQVEGAVDVVLAGCVGGTEITCDFAGGPLLCVESVRFDAMNALRAARHGPTEHKEKP